MTNTQFLARHISDFYSEVLNDLGIEDLALIFDPTREGELEDLLRVRFNEFRSAMEADQAIAQMELRMDRAADMRQRG